MTSKNNCVLPGAFIFFQAKRGLLIFTYLVLWPTLEMLHSGGATCSGSVGWKGWDSEALGPLLFAQDGVQKRNQPQGQ